MKFLFIGDIVGKAGRRAVRTHLPKLLKTHAIDFCAANGENIAHGFGITLKTAEELFASGVNLITSGNHVWDKKEVVGLLETRPILRPLNFPKLAPGKGVWRCEIGGAQVAIVNLIGQHNMGAVDNPFNIAEETIDALRSQGVSHIAIDFHAETTAEKNALLKALEGKVGFIFGTHTHVGTDDLLIANGAGYVSDIGLTGVRDEVIGMSSAEPLRRYRTGVKASFEVEEKGRTIFQAIVCELDESGRCVDAYKIKAYDEDEPFVSMRHGGGWQND